jgi:hypothetical protein
MISNRRRANQSGSALLIVFVFAAVVAIMLYREMPVAAFEARRQKEQLLIDRGGEYSRAVKLYVRKFQTFPPSIEALENTNRMRFLRNRYVDPFSGKDDWRLLHAGPGGIILDSKIKQNQLSTGGAAGTNGIAGSTSAPANSFGGSSLGNSAGFANTAATVNPLPGNGSSGLPAAFPMPPQPSNMTANAADPASGMPQDAQPADAPAPGAGQASGPSPIAGPGHFRSSNLPMQSPGTAQDPQDPQAMLQALLSNQNPQQSIQQPSAFNNGATGAAGGANTAPSAFGANVQTGNTVNSMNMGGGIAGVASKTAGPTIKIFNDQTNRSLWEFVYDMQKEAMANAPGLGTGNGTAPNGSISGVQGTQGNPSGVNSTNQNNTFGSGFGSSTTPAPTSQVPNP